MLIALLYFLAYCLLIGAIFWLVVWVLGLLGIAIPTRPLQLIGAAIFLLLLIGFLSQWPAFPRLLTILPPLG